MVDQDAFHGLGCGGVEVGAVLPGEVAWAQEFEVGLVDEGSGGEGVVGALAQEVELRGAAELVVDEGEELVARGGVACGGSGEEEGGVGGRGVGQGSIILEGDIGEWGCGVPQLRFTEQAVLPGLSMPRIHPTH